MLCFNITKINNTCLANLCLGLWIKIIFSPSRAQPQESTKCFPKKSLIDQHIFVKIKIQKIYFRWLTNKYSTSNKLGDNQINLPNNISKVAHWYAICLSVPLCIKISYKIFSVKKNVIYYLKEYMILLLLLLLLLLIWVK